MAARKLEHSQWKDYFDTFSKNNRSVIVNLEISGKDTGDQTEIRWQPLKGVSHDPKKDLLTIFTEDIDHTISKAKDIFVDERSGMPETIEIIDQDDNKQILKIRSH
jgi:TolB-like protein